MTARRVHTTAELMNARAADDRAWDQATEAERAASIAEHVAAGWKVCEHGTSCPPWDCRIETIRHAEDCTCAQCTAERAQFERAAAWDERRVELEREHDETYR